MKKNKNHFSNKIKIDFSNNSIKDIYLAYFSTDKPKVNYHEYHLVKLENNKFIDVTDGTEIYDIILWYAPLEYYIKGNFNNKKVTLNEQNSTDQFKFIHPSYSSMFEQNNIEDVVLYQIYLIINNLRKNDESNTEIIYNLNNLYTNYINELFLDNSNKFEVQKKYLKELTKFYKFSVINDNAYYDFDEVFDNTINYGLKRKPREISEYVDYKLNNGYLIKDLYIGMIGQVKKINNKLRITPVFLDPFIIFFKDSTENVDIYSQREYKIITNDNELSEYDIDKFIIREYLPLDCVIRKSNSEYFYPSEYAEIYNEVENKKYTIFNSDNFNYNFQNIVLSYGFLVIKQIISLNITEDEKDKLINEIKNIIKEYFGFNNKQKEIIFSTIFNYLKTLAKREIYETYYIPSIINEIDEVYEKCKNYDSTNNMGFILELSKVKEEIKEN